MAIKRKTMDNWRASLGFSDRLTAIQSIATAYRGTSKPASYAEAQSRAERCELEAYDGAASRGEYEQLCQRAIDAVETTHSVAPVIGGPQLSDYESEESSSAGIDIGDFENCLHHSDGLLSTIYRTKSKDGRLIALKVTTPHLMTAPHDSKREAKLLQDVASAHVIPLLSTFSLAGGRLILVFPFMKYGLDILLKGNMLTAPQVRSHLRDMFAALAHVHSLEIIHRDVKPSNILLNSPAGPAYLADFGIAWRDGVGDSEPIVEKIIDVGTTCYRPPELLFGSRDYDSTLDLWAAGCVVSEAVQVNHKQLFDSGFSGSELALIQSIFQTLGTPNEEIWPEASKLPDWGKVEFYEYPPNRWEDILIGVSTKGRDLASKLVRYESRSRLSAAEVLKHPYFST